MHKKLSLISTLTIVASLMVVHPVKMTFAQEKTTTIISPLGEWSVQAMGANTENGYCALSRAYNEGLVLTLGQNVMEDYSLAIDYQNQKLDMAKAYKVTLQPGPGQIRAYEMMPASQQAMVLRLGYDDSFITSLESSGVLKVDVDGKNKNFQISDFKSAQKKLADCMTGLTGKSDVKVASGFAAEKIENAEPIKVKKVEKKAPKASFKEAEVPKAIIEAPAKMAEEIIEVEEAIEVAPKVPVEPKVIEIAKVDTKEVQPDPAIATKKAAEEKAVADKAKKLADAQALKEKIEAEQKAAAEKLEAEKAAQQAKKLAEAEAKQKALDAKQALAEEKALELQKKQDDLKKAQEMQKLALEKKEKQEALAQQAAEEKQKAEQLKAKQEADKKALAEAKKVEEMKRAEEEAQKLADQKAKAEKTQALQRAEKEAQEAERLTAKAEEAKQRQFEADKKAAEIKSEADRIAKEQAEKVQQAQEIEIAKVELEEAKPITPMIDVKPVIAKPPVQPDPSAFTERVDVKTQQELKEAQEKLKALEQENRQLYLEARKAQGAIDSVVVETGNQALKKIRNYERKLEAAQADNLILSREVEEMRKLQENGRLDAVSGDATLEQSTRRYNESQREIKRLGLLLEQQRNAHRLEKQELEQMLFDPVVTEERQRKRLAELEAQLAAAEAKAQQSTEPLLQQKMQAEKEAQLAKQRVAELEKQKAADELKRKEAEAAKQKLAQLEKARAADLAKQKQLELELARKNQEKIIQKKETEESDRSKQLNLAKLTKQKEAELKVKQEKLRLKEMEIKLEQADRKLNAIDEVVEFKVVPSPSGAPSIVSLDKRETTATSSENNRRLSPPPSYASTRPSSISRQANDMAVQIEPKIAAKLVARTANTIKPMPSVSSTSTSVSFNDSEIKDVLTRAGVGVNGTIANQGVGRYVWKSGALSGRAQVVPIQRAGSLDQFVENYIGQAKSSCNGDFASLPAANVTSGKGFEIACVGASQGTSSSVIFKQKGSEIIAISHETSAEDMDVAMDARDRVAGSL